MRYGQQSINAAVIAGGPTVRGRAMVNAAPSAYDIKQQAIRQLRLLNAYASTVNGPDMPDGWYQLEESAQRTLGLIAEAFPGATDAELRGTYITGIDFGRIGRDLERMGRQVLESGALQQVARGNPVLVVARNGFLLLLKENAMDIAAALEKSGKLDDIKTVWEGMGGDWSAFMSAYRQGIAKVRRGVSALPNPWDWQGWQTLTLRDALRGSLREGMNPEWFGIRGIGRRPRYDEDPNFMGPPPPPDTRPVGNVWGTLSDIFKTAGPVISSVFGAAQTAPPAGAQQQMTQAAGPATPVVSNEVLQSLINQGLQMGTDAARRALEQATRPPGPPPPAPPQQRPPASVISTRTRGRTNYARPSQQRRNDIGGPLLILAAAVALSKK